MKHMKLVIVTLCTLFLFQFIATAQVDSTEKFIDL